MDIMIIIWANGPGDELNDAMIGWNDFMHVVLINLASG